MKTKKKSRFLTFCFSLLPGAGEMYMGFMNMGVSLMFFFFAAVVVPMFLRIDELSLFGFIIWAYGFFHANHLASLNDEEFNQVKDTCICNLRLFSDSRQFGEKQQKWMAAVLIVTGVFLLWNTFTDMAYSLLPRFVYDWMRIVGSYAPRGFVAVVIIFLGIKMISGRKEQLAELENGKNAEAGNGSSDITGREE